MDKCMNTETDNRLGSCLEVVAAKELSFMIYVGRYCHAYDLLYIGGYRESRLYIVTMKNVPKF